MISLYMPGSKLAKYQYAHKKNVETFRDFIFDLQERRSIHISRIIIQYAILKGIGYKEHQYLSTGLLPFLEFSADCLFPGVEWFINQGGQSTIVRGCPLAAVKIQDWVKQVHGTNQRRWWYAKHLLAIMRSWLSVKWTLVGLHLSRWPIN